jgi:hypothetical protein
MEGSELSLAWQLGHEARLKTKNVIGVLGVGQ